MAWQTGHFNWRGGAGRVGGNGAGSGAAGAGARLADTLAGRACAGKPMVV